MMISSKTYELRNDEDYCQFDAISLKECGLDVVDEEVDEKVVEEEGRMSICFLLLRILVLH